MSAAARNGPTTAPAVSIERSKPNAFPKCAAGTPPASRALRAGVLTPRPIQAAERAAAISHARPAAPKSAVEIAVTT